ncbi:MAG: DUF998 domain-containing protein [Acidobacteriota bacterium]|nr:DUF998 domain-containing protein [Acidobacteriota bacterium]
MKTRNAAPLSISSNSAGAGIERAIRLGSIIWILAIQFFVAQIVVQSAWVTPFSLTQNFISDLGNTTCGPYGNNYVCSPLHVRMNLSFVALGLIILFGGALIHSEFPAGHIRTAGLTLLSVAGAGIIMVGLFPENENLTLHKVGAAGHFVIGNLSVVVLGISLMLAGGRQVLAAYSIGSGLIGLLATALFISDKFLGLGIGGMERLAAYPLPLWLIVTGIAFLSTVSRSRI